MKVYKALASALAARKNCEKSKNEEWYDRHNDRIDILMEMAPSGSGFDSGTHVADDCRPERLVFYFGYHHMSEYGCYVGWTHHRVVVTSSLVFDFKTKISPGVSKQEIMEGLWTTAIVEVEDPVDDHDLDYFHQVFDEWLSSEVELPK